ncbi:hypothetical protein [Vreelandella lionensis]|uniref:hypothetical protein n=1 Tax=Vreelandella lionensis TaxID=1144478 RepID=UPI001FB2A396|nr:hypothetical protein [Halomonas lionensis]
MAHAIADHLAAAELHFFTVVGGVFFDLNPKLGVAQAHAVAYRGAVHIGVGAPTDSVYRFHVLPLLKDEAWHWGGHHSWDTL